MIKGHNALSKPEKFPEQIPTRMPNRNDKTKRVPLWKALEIADSFYESHSTKHRKHAYSRYKRLNRGKRND